ncbi:MAG: hypothetical protein A4E49_01696 [Methanosaeta sp. PtaU1.Bin112]|nr:MAG: hypothetical protein A4E49_01696 [Methanosaeta sp. PtaU1.Bin112]
MLGRGNATMGSINEPAEAVGRLSGNWLSFDVTAI